MNKESQAYKLVLMDWNMPRMNGIEATKMIKSDPDISHPHYCYNGNCIRQGKK